MTKRLRIISIPCLACTWLLLRHLNTIISLPSTSVLFVSPSVFEESRKLDENADYTTSPNDDSPPTTLTPTPAITNTSLPITMNSNSLHFVASSSQLTNISGGSSRSNRIFIRNNISKVTEYHAIVIEEYKLLFMPVAKVGSSLIKRLLMRMNHNPNWCVFGGFGGKSGIHAQNVNQFVKLGSLPKAKKLEIMSSPNWTRAIFVREPKERILSAFQDKALRKKGNYMKRECCSGKTPDSEYCKEHIQEFAYFINVTQTYCTSDLHWMLLHRHIDEHWWPFINFVGYSDTLSDDFEKLLKSLYSTKDGVSAWERFGKTGWDFVSKNNGTACNETSNVAFGHQILHTKANGTSTSSMEKLKQYYTPELEAAVENLYKKDWESPYYHFEPIKIF